MSVDDILDVASEEDSSSLRQCFGFDDVCASLSPIDGLVVVPELAELQGDGPGVGEEVILFGVVLLHGHKVKSQEVLVGQDVDAWEVVDALVQVHPE